MSDFTVDEFKAIVLSSLGEEEASAVGPNSLDTSLSELGIDSLGILEIVNQIRGKYAPDIDDEAIGADSTPRKTIELVRTMQS